MIPLETALKYIGSEDQEKIKDISVRRLTGEDARPVGDRWQDEDSTDLLLPLLSKDAFSSSIREAVLGAWRKVYSEVLGWIADTDSEPRLDAPQGQVVNRLCRVVEMARPDELRESISTLFRAAIDNPKAERFLVYTILSAWRSYGRIWQEDLPRIQGLLEREAFAGVAFDILLRNDPEDKRLEEGLFTLWCKQLEQGFKVDAPFLAVSLEEKLKKNDPVIRVLRRIRSECPKTWEKVELQLNELADDLKEEWPREWLREAQIVALSSREIGIESNKGPASVENAISAQFYRMFKENLSSRNFDFVHTLSHPAHSSSSGILHQLEITAISNLKGDVIFMSGGYQAE